MAWVNRESDSYWTGINGITYSYGMWESGDGVGETRLDRKDGSYYPQAGDYGIKVTVDWNDQTFPVTMTITTYLNVTQAFTLLDGLNEYEWTFSPATDGYGQVDYIDKISFNHGFGDFYTNTANVTEIQIADAPVSVTMYPFWGDSIFSVSQETNGVYLYTHLDVQEGVSHTCRQMDFFFTPTPPDVEEIRVNVFDENNNEVSVSSTTYNSNNTAIRFTADKAIVGGYRFRIGVNDGNFAGHSIGNPFGFLVRDFRTDVEFSPSEPVWTSYVDSEEPGTGFGSLDAVQLVWYLNTDD